MRPVAGRAVAPEFDAAGLRRRLDAGLADMALDLDQDARGRLIRYVALLARWNRAYNLTAVRDPAEMVPRHILDSLTVLPHLEGRRCLDVGSGAGLPGLVLALAQPATDWLLLDSNAKKCRFLTRAKAELAIDNVRVVRSRVEDFHPQARFSTIISRALSNLAEFVAAAVHLLAPGGRLLAMKGRDPDHELPALGGLGVQAEVVPLSVPGIEDVRRHLVIVTAAGASGPARA